MLPHLDAFDADGTLPPFRVPTQVRIHTRKRLAPALAAAAAALLASGPAPGAVPEFYFESPVRVSRGAGAYPLAVEAGGRVAALWQENVASVDGGEAWLSLASYGPNGTVRRDRIAGPFPYRGDAPLLFSAVADRDGTLGVAVASGENTIAVYRSFDGGLSFGRPVTITLDIPGVAPRLFPRAAGGWYLFIARGQGDSLSIFISRSDDGLSWTPFEAFVPAETGLRLNFLPSAAVVGNTDVVVFQSLAGGERPSFQLFSRTSPDGGATWSEPRRFTDFLDPVRRDQASPDLFDNQRPHLLVSGGEPWIAWERRTLAGQAQVYAGRVDSSGTAVPGSVERVTLGAGSCSEPRLFDVDGQPAVVWYDDRRGGSRVYASFREGALWRERELSADARGDATFGRAVYRDGKLWSFWQTGKGSDSAVLALTPDATVRAPELAAVDFTPGAETRRERATVRWETPQDSSGIVGYSWLWTRDSRAEPAAVVMAPESLGRVTNTADADGAWYFAIRAQDFAGNWSTTSRLSFVKDTTPPGTPWPDTPSVGADGFLSSNTFSVSWTPPPDGDVAGYSWVLEYLGPLDRLPARKRPAPAPAPAPVPAAATAPAEGAPTEDASATPIPATTASAPEYSSLPTTAYETRLWYAADAEYPGPTIRTTEPRASFTNLEDGYYAFAVLAMDRVGNIGDAARVILRADKFVPFTLVSDVVSSRDDFGTLRLRILGRGFADDGPMTRVVIDADAKEPYDRLYELSARGYTIRSDRLIEGIEAAELPEGSYRVGVYHPVRGWYWTRPVLAVDISGTVKFGDFGQPWKPAWTFLPPTRFVIDTGTLFMILALLFPAVGLLLSIRQVAVVAREGKEIRLEALALLEGRPMAKKERERAAKAAMRRGTGLTAKFSLTIIAMVIFVVLLVSIPLGLQMVQTQSEVQARGLQQKVGVLLESAAQGARSYLPARNQLELGLLPNQTTALAEANYLTITGFGPADVADPDIVWATNDPGIMDKIDGATLAPGVSALDDELSPAIPDIAAELNTKAAAEVGELAATIQQLTDESNVLARKENLTAEEQVRLDDIASSVRELANTLNKRLAALADASVASEPPFDPTALATEAATYLFYKPVMFRQGREPAYYRGMVRLSVSTELIVAEVRRARDTLIRSVSIIAAIAVAIGALGSVLLAGAIISPIRKLVKGIETIRDMEDKRELSGFTIDVRSRDELETLATTINEMTAGLVQAAKEQEFLTVGKEVQKMFIPLETNTMGEKLTTGLDEQPTHSFYGYYEGAKGVSGDLFDYRKLDDRYWAFIKCDVAGKGVPAALIMAGVATIFATNFQEWTFARDGIHLDKLTYRINEFIESRGFKGRFAAFIMGVYDSRTGAAYLCHAGDKFVRVYKAAQGEVVTTELPSSPTAGTFPNDLVEATAPFRQTILKLEPGDTLLLYTDGFEEASRARRGRDFRQLVEMKKVRDADGGERDHSESLVEQLGEDRIRDIVRAAMSRGTFVLRKEDDPLGPDAIWEFDFSTLEGTPRDMVLALAAVEKVFRMVPDPAAGDDDLVIVDAKIDDILSRTLRQYKKYCADKRPHPDPRRTEYVYYAHLKEDEQYDDLTMMVIRRNA